MLAPEDVMPTRRIGLTHADLESAVQSLDTFIDVQENELVQLYNLAVDHAFSRHSGLTCGDIMSRDVVSVKFETELETAWKQYAQDQGLARGGLAKPPNRHSHGCRLFAADG